MHASATVRTKQSKSMSSKAAIFTSLRPSQETQQSFPQVEQRTASHRANTICEEAALSSTGDHTKNPLQQSLVTHTTESAHACIPMVQSIEHSMFTLPPYEIVGAALVFGSGCFYSTPVADRKVSVAAKTSLILDVQNSTKTSVSIGRNCKIGPPGCTITSNCTRFWQISKNGRVHIAGTFSPLRARVCSCF